MSQTTDQEKETTTKVAETTVATDKAPVLESGADRACSDLILIIIAFFCPPVTAFLCSGCGIQLLLNIILTLIGWIPGIIHAIWLVLNPTTH